jgi:hypothetical protein
VSPRYCCCHLTLLNLLLRSNPNTDCISLNIAASSTMSLRQSSIHSLALEVLQEIFVLCLPKQDMEPTVANAPLLLCRICSSWRNIAINMPELWQSLNIGPSFRLPRNKWPTNGNHLGALDAEQGGVVCEHHISLVKGWFGRAKEQPLLSLYFWFDMKGTRFKGGRSVAFRIPLTVNSASSKVPSFTPRFNNCQTLGHSQPPILNTCTQFG